LLFASRRESERFASWNAKHPRSHEIEIIQELLVKRRGDVEFEVSIRPGFFGRDDNEPVIALFDQYIKGSQAGCR
jgi:hypothetical protein